jgi:hypothetical protein
MDRFETIDTSLTLPAGEAVAQLAVALRPVRQAGRGQVDRGAEPGPDSGETRDEREPGIDSRDRAGDRTATKESEGGAGPGKKATDPKALAEQGPAIRETLHHYERSLEERDLKSFARLWVALPPKELQDFERSLRDVRSQSIEIEENGLELDGNQATVRFREKRSIEPVSGERTRTDRTRIMVMRRIGAEWLIQSLR